MKYFRSLLFFLTLLSTFSLFGQVQSIALDWSGTIRVSLGEHSYEVQTVKDFGLDNGRPFFALQQKHSNSYQEVEIFNEIYEKVPKAQEQVYKAIGVDFQDQITIEAKIVTESGQPNFSCYVLPIRVSGGTMERLVKFDVRFKSISNVQQKDYAANSILGTTSGKWYRIAVNKDGIYKIDRSFLEACGFNTSNLNPAHVHIFGNGEGVIPELNASPITDDLAQNAIAVIGEADGSFDDNDYLLFYGWGPHRWEPTGGNQFTQVRHPYSEQSFYFIYIGSDVAPLRIATAPTIDTPTDTLITAYAYRDVYENDLVNLVKGGQRWYGEEFDVELSRNFNFTIPNVTQDPVQFQVSFASNSRT
ncbi:MAG: hypothetical protein RL511_486, partial [Bacteroidota bacterium]